MAIGSRVVENAPSWSGYVVEVANARVRVGRGFDPALLGEVVRALGGAR